MIYINKYATSQEVQAAIDNQELSKPYVAYITGTDEIDWNGLEPTPSAPTGPFSLQLVTGGTSVVTIQGTEDEYGMYAWNNLGDYEAFQFSILDSVGNPITVPHYSACGHNIEPCGNVSGGEGEYDPESGIQSECLDEYNVLMSGIQTLCRINDIIYNNTNTDRNVQVNTGTDESTPESICNCQGGTWDGTDCIFGGGESEGPGVDPDI
jgi:hypothetical protein